LEEPFQRLALMVIKNIIVVNKKDTVSHINKLVPNCNQSIVASTSRTSPSTVNQVNGSPLSPRKPAMQSTGIDVQKDG